MRVINLKEVKNRVRKNEYLINSIDELVESTPEYSSSRKRPKSIVESKILRKFKSKQG